MTHRCKFPCSALVIGVLGPASASADIIVRFDPADAGIDSPGDTTTVNIVAYIPEEDAILGWGLDLIVEDPGVADITGFMINTALFNAISSPDGDDLGGLAFPVCIWGYDVLLATVEFTGYGIGITEIMLADDYPDDLTEGFALCGTGFASMIYGSGLITVPEPASVSLLALGLLALRRR